MERCGQSLRALARGLHQVAEDVADGDEAVLDVVVHLTGEIAERDAPLGFSQPGGAGSQPLRHRAEQARERADLVVAVAREGDVEAIHVDLGGLLGEPAQRAADARREPAPEQECDAAADRHRREQPPIDPATQRRQRCERVGDDDARGDEPPLPGVFLRHERHGELADHLGPRIDARERVGRQRHRNRELGVPRQARNKRRVHGHAADQSEPFPAQPAQPERIDPGEGDHRPLGRARPDQRHAARGGGEQSREIRLETVELVPEVTRADDPPAVVLDLKHRQPREPHRVAGVVQQVGAVAALKGRRTEPIVAGDRVAQRVQAAGDPGALLFEIGPNDADERGHAAAVLCGEAVRHQRADGQAEHDEGHEQHHPEAEQNAGAERHRGARRRVLSKLRLRRTLPRRTIAAGRVSTSGITAAGEPRTSGGICSASRQRSSARRRRART